MTRDGKRIDFQAVGKKEVFQASQRLQRPAAVRPAERSPTNDFSSPPNQ